MVLVYLPTKLGDFVGANVGKYSSTMVRIWDFCWIFHEINHPAIGGNLTMETIGNPQMTSGQWWGRKLFYASLQRPSVPQGSEVSFNGKQIRFEVTLCRWMGEKDGTIHGS